MDAENWYFRRRWDDFRAGTKRVRLSFGSENAEAKLYDEGVPTTTRSLISLLPLEIPVVHVAWSGDMVMSARSYSDGPNVAENSVRLPRVGDITWDPKFGEICFVYGTAEARLPSGENQLVVFGEVNQGLSRLASFCRARRFEGIGKITMSLI